MIPRWRLVIRAPPADIVGMFPVRGPAGLSGHHLSGHFGIHRMRMLARLSVLAAAATVLLSAAPGFAASKAGDYAVKGIGSDRCADYVKAAEAKSPLLDVFAGWIEGHLTATNLYRPDTFDIAPWQATRLLMALIYAHCQNNPDQRLFAAVRNLEAVLAKSRLAAKSEVVEIDEGGGKKLALYHEILKRAQQALIDRGFLEGRADGKFGPKTRAALEAFQEKEGLKKTGLPDQETLFKLLLEADIAPAKG